MCLAFSFVIALTELNKVNDFRVPRDSYVKCKGWFSLAHKHKHKPAYAEAVRCWSLAPFVLNFPNKRRFCVCRLMLMLIRQWKPALNSFFNQRCPRRRRGVFLKVSSLLQIDVSFSCVCPVIDHEFRHNIVKVAVDPRGYLWRCYDEIHCL